MSARTNYGAVGKKTATKSGVRTLRHANITPIMGDQKVILQAALTIEKIAKIDLTGFTPVDIVEINSKRDHLQSLMQLKCEMAIKENCLFTVRSNKSVLLDLQALFNEEKQKLKIIKKENAKRRAKTIESFVKCSSDRKNLSQEINDKMSSELLIKETERLRSIAHFYFFKDALQLIVNSSVEELKRLKLQAIYWINLILETDIKILCFLVDSLSLECISNIYSACQNFNYVFVNQIKSHPHLSLNLIKTIAEHQANSAAIKLNYFLQNEFNKNSGSILKNLSNNHLNKNISKTEEVTSDYCSASSSLALPQTKKAGEYFNYNSLKRCAFITKSSKSLKEVLNLIVQSNQRILLKLLFCDQNKNFEINRKSTRKQWVKFEDDQKERQQQIFRQSDDHFWNVFWNKIKDNLIDNICFGKYDLNTPIRSVLYNYSCEIFFCHLFNNCYNFDGNELSPETLKLLKNLETELLFEVSLQLWNQNMLTAKKKMNQTTVSIDEVDNLVGTAVGNSMVKCLDALSALALRFSADSRSVRYKALSLVVNHLTNLTCNAFLSWVERRSAVSLSMSQFPAFLALTFLDVQNLTELLTLGYCESESRASFVDSLQAIKLNSLKKFKKEFSSQTNQLLAESLPIKGYRKRVSTSGQWLSPVVSSALQPSLVLLAKSCSFEASLLRRQLVDHFALLLLSLVEQLMTDGRLKFSPSGAAQLQHHVKKLCDWIADFQIPSTDSVAKLKLLSENISSRSQKSQRFVKHNRVAATDLLLANESNSEEGNRPSQTRGSCLCVPF